VPLECTPVGQTGLLLQKPEIREPDIPAYDLVIAGSGVACLYGGLGLEPSTSSPARRISGARDVAEAVLLTLTNTFMTGSVLHIDGGRRWS
jgi:hypothetical protein